MKKIIPFIILIASFFSSCSSDSESENLTTKLELTVKDEMENVVANSSVKLYPTLTDLNNQTNQIGTTQFSDSTGKVIFDNLSAVNYFWLAENGCSNSSNGVFMTSSALTANSKNVFTTTISGTGTLKIENGTSAQIEIILNATDHYFIEAGMTLYIYNRKSGEDISIEVIRPGFAYGFPTFTLNCGQTKTVTII